MAAKTMTDFARRWDESAGADSRLHALRLLCAQTFSMQKPADGEAPTAEEAVVSEAIKEMIAGLVEDGPRAALEILTLTRKLPRARLHRQELLRDVERAIGEVAAGRCETMLEASAHVRDRASVVGRKLPKRTVSTPLLLKGLEFDHVIVPDAPHFYRERNAQAKLFYVAISRTARSLTITSPHNFVHLPRPAI
jgi:DNA helicase-2/ATP-dependent DNA helicase PcrA